MENNPEYPHGMDVIPSAFDLFEKFNKSGIATGTVYEEIYPQSNITGENNTNSLSFHIHGTDQVIDFSETYILLTGEVMGNAKTGDAAAVEATAAAAKFGLINNFPSSLFSRMTVLMNNKEVTSTTNFPYITYLNTRLNNDNENLRTHFQLEGWLPDDPANMDDTDSTIVTSSLAKRKIRGNNNKTFQFIIRPFTSIFSMEKVLLPHVDVEIVLDRNVPPKFYFMYPTVAQTVYNYSFNLTQAALFVRKMDTNAEFNVGVEGAMTHAMAPVVYNLRNPQIIAINIPQNTTTHSASDVFHGFTPERVLIMLVQTRAYRGDNTLNPYNFQPFNLESIGLFKNGAAYPHPVIKTDFTANQYAQAYYLTLKSLQAPEPGAPTISYEEFKSGTTIFSYDLTPDQAGGIDPHHNVQKKTNIRIDVNFKIALQHETMMLIYYEQDVSVAIDHTRSVSVETVY